MSKEGLKEDIINDINRLLKEEKEVNIEEMTMPDMRGQVLNQGQELNPQQIKQLQQLQQQQLEQQMQQQIQQQLQQQIQQQLQQQMQKQMQQQMQQQMQGNQIPQIPPQIHPLNAQLNPQLHPQMQQQLMSQLNGANNGIPNGPKIQQQLVQHFEGGEKGKDMMNDVKDIVYLIREPFVLLLLCIIILSPQVNTILNKIPYLKPSEEEIYPSYMGIVFRSVLLVTIYFGVKKLNLI